MTEFFDIHYEDIELIRDLWEKNREYHENISEYFSETYRILKFDDRIKGFSNFSKDKLKITVAKNNDEYIGYCISTIIDGKGELQSIHVDKNTRGNGIGMQLASKHIEWMKEKNCKAIGVTISQENESTVLFYKKLGFYLNTLYMEMK